MKLSKSIGAWVADPAANPSGLAFAAMFATFLFVAYVLLYALTHLPKAQTMPLEKTPRTPAPLSA
jgi:hypothetical protein